jgi:flagellar motility protein MotE (MotC chaperone)
MKTAEIAEIMGTLNPKVVGQILAKMEPKKAAEVTTALRSLPAETKK